MLPVLREPQLCRSVQELKDAMEQDGCHLLIDEPSDPVLYFPMAYALGYCLHEIAEALERYAVVHSLDGIIILMIVHNNVPIVYMSSSLRS